MHARRAFFGTLAAALCTGCATGVVEVRKPDSEMPARKTLAVQSTALDPRNGGQMVGPEALRPGDILLSADAAPRWLSPRDSLHMRKGDVPSVKVHQTLAYVGHLRYTVPAGVSERGAGVQ